MSAVRKVVGALSAAALVLGAGHMAGAQDGPGRPFEEIAADLAKGGSVMVMRHANSPAGQAAAVGLTEGCILQEGRGLDAQGFYQARFIGESLKEAGAPIAAAYTSDICRAWDTARLAAGGAPVSPEPALKTTDAEAVDAFKAWIAAEIAASPGENILLVSHSNVVPLYAEWAGPGEIPSGLVLIVDPRDWTVRDRLQLDFGLPDPR